MIDLYALSIESKPWRWNTPAFKGSNDAYLAGNWKNKKNRDFELHSLDLKKQNKSTLRLFFKAY
jgi:hypothetical protein